MLPYTYLYLGLNCSHQCLYCPFKKEPKEDIEQIQIRPTSGRQSNLCFWGGDPAGRHDFLELTFKAVRQSWQRIKVISNATALANPERLWPVVNAGCRFFELYLWGPDPDLHGYLTRSSNNFMEVLQVLQNLQQWDVPKFIAINLPICKENYQVLTQTVSLCASLGINRVILNYCDSKLPFSELKAYLQNAINLAVLNRLWVLTENIPFCILPEMIVHCRELFAGWQRPYRFRYVHLDICHECVFRDICLGIMSEYRFNDLRPVKKIKYLEDIKRLYEEKNCLNCL